MYQNRNRLPYPYSYTTEDTYPNGVVVGAVDPSTRNDCNLVILQLTDEVLHNLTSAIQAGADLIYPDQWQTVMDWWAYAAQLANTGRFVNCEGTEILSICDLVADCIRNDLNVQQALNEVIEFPPGNGNFPVPSQLSVTDTLDCVWGASFSTFEIVLDGWNSIKAILEAATEFTDLISPLSERLGWLTPRQLEIAELLFSTGLAAADVYMNLQSTQDDWACALFKCIVKAGRPYTITDECLLSAFATLDPFGVLSEDEAFVDLIYTAAGPSTLKSFWRVRSDDDCNNDWRTVCNLTCGDPVDDIVTWDDPRIIEITANGVPITVTSSSGIVFPSGWSPIVVQFDKPYCGVGFRTVVSRSSTAQRPQFFDHEFGDETGTTQIGIFGPSDYVVNLNNGVSDRLIIEATNPADDVTFGWQLANIANPGINLNEAD